MPRRSSPRTAVPAGAVGIAGEFSACTRAFPRAAGSFWVPPIRRCGIPMPTRRRWYSRETACAIAAWISCRSLLITLPARSERLPAAAHGGYRCRPAHPLPRPGPPRCGRSRRDPSGAADRAAAATANVAVGNPRGATVLENIGGIKLHALTDTVICVTGATARVRLGEMPVHLARPVLVTAGQTVTVDPLRWACAITWPSAAASSPNPSLALRPPTSLWPRPGPGHHRRCHRRAAALYRHDRRPASQPTARF